MSDAMDFDLNEYKPVEYLYDNTHRDETKLERLVRTDPYSLELCKPWVIQRLDKEKADE